MTSLRTKVGTASLTFGSKSEATLYSTSLGESRRGRSVGSRSDTRAGEPQNVPSRPWLQRGLDARVRRLEGHAPKVRGPKQTNAAVPPLRHVLKYAAFSIHIA